MKQMNVMEQSSQNDDFSLIQAFLNGDQEAFATLVKKHQHAVFGLCCRMLENTEDAQDIAQDVFVKVFRNLRGFRQDSAFSTWLYRITVNTCKNKLSSSRYRERYKELKLERPDEEIEEDRRPELSDDRYAPEPVYEQKMTAGTVRQAIDSLPSEQKILVVLCDLEGRSYEEIAQMTHLKLGTVKSKLARARQRLRCWLEGVANS